MTKFGKNALTALSAIAVSAMASTAVSAATLAEIQESGTIRIAVANEIPYGYVDPTGAALGAGPDVAKAIMEKLGVDNIEWVTTNFSSLIPGLQADRFDMVAAEMAIRPDRCTQVLFSQPNTSYGEGLLVAEGNPKGIHAYTDFAENPDLKVAIMAGADQLDMMQELGVSEGNLVTIAANADAISTVSTGRADAYAATSLTASGLADQGKGVEVASDFSDPVIGGVPVRSWGGFTFASGNEELRDAVNGALAEFKATPEWSETLMGYGFTQSDVDGSGTKTTEELCAAE
ncbi:MULTISPECIES: ectoine/hydroxyectoine ABC transporter substrate-binding protein EhuB [Devosia]|jgi:polar amino acid transport system substrate-binding protein|uniref:Ectoine/hydroxyectoine ABC transporter substrate-binding protein EhuB n=1 Tax=Devosia litorisediminis TaxID=2829817 RepID=A0A942E6X8_9HYPH|nr:MULTISPECIES: ectoine/hydroxyectoine ABC transporter substrate-binding protein EhuB [Devosia]MBS3849258.1 ectoine/hydroxyectoine ABC transporter substrate-binding protein EhuB [Devosia litorisediminis]MCZ4344738.1 ectoine/hydroxyectoine ABC transporter substrate-binding protein EhuB [Devosia neptuniae]|tara:strand:- start:12822 stop:13688 length:867 start_codon:yes stop_codon:yes gene_type:complete